MLSTLVYRSRASASLSAEEISQLLNGARLRNKALGITGILIFDGVHFVQLLEGPDSALDSLFDAIRQDRRHQHVVQLLRDYAPVRRFDGDEMLLIDLRGHGAEGASATILNQLKGEVNLALTDDRVLKILLLHAGAGGASLMAESDLASEWRCIAQAASAGMGEHLLLGQPYQFALQPIVDALRREVTSFECLLRSSTGGSPEQLFASLTPEQRYVADLESKALAFQLASRLKIETAKLSVNLFPMSLIGVPNAVDRLLGQIAASGLHPSQVIVEVTEQEAISRLDAFGSAIKQLRKAGIGVAIDDFGAGFAGLSLLAEFQPDKLKIDRKILQNIHLDGSRQAIVRAIVQACTAMGITPVAEGVETLEEFCWLNAAGVRRFQGYLFARPALNSIPAVRWPERMLD